MNSVLESAAPADLTQSQNPGNPLPAPTSSARQINGLRRAREAKLLTQEDLARKMEVNVAQVWRWEKGHDRPRMARIRKLARVLGLKVGQLQEEAFWLPTP